MIGNIELPTYEIDVRDVGGKTINGDPFSMKVVARLFATISLERGRVEPPVADTLEKYLMQLR
jgi:hypothetical protein